MPSVILMEFAIIRRSKPGHMAGRYPEPINLHMMIAYGGACDVGHLWGMYIVGSNHTCVCHVTFALSTAVYHACHMCHSVIIVPCLASAPWASAVVHMAGWAHHWLILVHIALLSRPWRMCLKHSMPKVCWPSK